MLCRKSGCITHFFNLIRKIFRGNTNIFKELLINEQIKANDVRLISQSGEQLGIVSLSEAFAKADEANLDLVMITANANPPVCKIMNYGKYRYEQIKKDKEARKNQKVVELKEIQLSMVIQANDLEIKAKRARAFLQDGNKLKIVLRMRGREQAFVDRAKEIVENFYQGLTEFGIAEKPSECAGRNVILIVSPKK